ncbi:ribonuclease H-like domain-containing protein [Tanacetum coccineum]
MTRRVLLQYDSKRDLYPVIAPSPIPHAFLVSQHTWHQRLGHPGGEVLCRLVSSNFILYNKEKPPVLCHACHLGKHVRLPFVISSTMISSCFDIIHSDVWTLPIPSLSVSPLSKSYRDAFNDPNWQNAMRDEYIALIKNKTWTLVPRPPDTNIVRFMWLFRHKYLADGTLSRYKERLVANGSTQLEGVNVDETFSPVVKPGTIRIVLSLAASRHWPIHQLDVKNAFLHGDLSETGTDLLLYVDDIVLTASSEILLQQIISSLHQEFAMTDLGSLNYFLGISVIRDSSGLFLSQKKYDVELLDRAHMVNCNPSRTPVDTESKLGSDGDPVSDPTLYQSLAGSLHYSPPPLQIWLRTMMQIRLAVLLHADRLQAEYRGVANVVAETCWLNNLLCELHTPLSSVTLVYCDNASAVYLSCNPVQHQRTKHIEIDIHFVRDLVASGEVRVLHVPSRYQFADIFTKGLPSALFEEFWTVIASVGVLYNRST